MDMVQKNKGSEVRKKKMWAYEIVDLTPDISSRKSQNDTWTAGGEKALGGRPPGIRASQLDYLPRAAFGKKKLGFVDCTGDKRNLKQRPTRNSKEN